MSLSDAFSSGRPPDAIGTNPLVLITNQSRQQIQHICSGTSLERPGSPISMDVQGRCKKVRSDDIQDLVGVSDIMDLEEDRGYRLVQLT
ncbi:hypothetical protein V6N12_058903 [Hibiscus sabdariffa]|uniref:Uncharacterized protein n=1 Tax=Hibiscus sabdariffa TaxID=183260 RepID=A0ABR2EWB1_9ROSI